MGEEKRHEMMQNLFGDQSEEEEEIYSEHESNPHPNYASDEAEGVMEPEGEGEGEVEVEGHGEAEVESDGDLRDLEPDPGESEGERVQSSQEVDIGDQREESKAKETDSDEKEDYGQRVVTSRRREVIESGSERSEENHYPDNEDEEVDQTRSLSKSPEEEKDPTHLSHSLLKFVMYLVLLTKKKKKQNMQFDMIWSKRKLDLLWKRKGAMGRVQDLKIWCMMKMLVMSQMTNMLR
ncbi:hypothetical protein V6Z11_D09G040600 [Gossypium hirsutum]